MRTFRLALSGIPGELGRLVAFPVRAPKSTAFFLLGTAALVALDRHTTEFWQDKVEPIFAGFSFPTLFFVLYTPQETQYVIAAVGATDIGGHNHWISDMVAGAVLGTAVGKLVLNNDEKRHEAQSDLFIIPSVSRNSVGFASTMEL